MPEFRQSFPAAGLSLERGTANVPNDGRFHLLVDGHIIGSFRSEKQAQAKYRELRDAHLEQHPVQKTKVNVQDLIQRDADRMSNKQLLWEPEDYQRLDRKTKKIPRA